MDMRQRQQQVLQFRTPQHPCSGTNNWGGASPLLARNIPEESLEQRYLRLNHNRNRDEIFRDHHFFYVSKKIEASKYEYEYEFPPTPAGRKGLLWKLIWPPSKNNKIITLGFSKKKRKLPRLDWNKRWPNGWC